MQLRLCEQDWEKLQWKMRSDGNEQERQKPGEGKGDGVQRMRPPVVLQAHTHISLWGPDEV